MNHFPAILLILLFSLCCVSCQPETPGRDVSGDSPQTDSIADTLLFDRKNEKYPHDLLPPLTEDIAHYEKVIREGGILVDENSLESQKVLRIDITGDGTEDYFVWQQEWRFGLGFFVNGKTGRHIPADMYSDPGAMNANLHWHRPNEEDGLEFEVVDVWCGDDQKELLVRYGSYFEGASNYMELYRYDQDSGKVDRIFEHLVSENIQGTWDTTFQRNTTNYIDVLYQPKKCLDTIKVRSGVRKPGADLYYWKGIWPRKDARDTVWVFEPDSNKFSRQPPPAD